MQPQLTTLCYIEKDDRYLMLHRVKKQHDENAGKYIGVGGHFEEGESPEECLRREVFEETGLTLAECRFRGIVTFVSDEWGTEYMFLYTATAAPTDAPLPVCAEGVLSYVPKDEIMGLRLWEGDRIFLRLLLADAPVFSLKLRYEGEALVEAILDGKELPLR